METHNPAPPDFVFASPALNGKQPLWGQTMNAQFVKPAAVELGLVSEEDRFGWPLPSQSKHVGERYGQGHHGQPDHAPSCQPDITAAIYTHGNFGKALDAQRIYMEQLLPMKPTSESTQ